MRIGLIGILIYGFLIGCTDPQIAPELEQKIARLGQLQCLADAQAAAMQPFFIEARELGLEQHAGFLKQKRKYHRCLASINAEIQQLLFDFDAAVLKMGGQSTERGQLMYQLLEQAKSSSACDFKEFCRLRLEPALWTDPESATTKGL
jgi:hypothetical protein